MANQRNGNTHYVDTAGAISTDTNTKIAYIVISALANGSQFVLEDPGGATKIALGVAVEGTSQVFDFSRIPLLFPNGVTVNSITDCLVTIVYTNRSGGD